MQNENGPCPLLAAANSLLLKDSIKLPSNCIGANVCTIDQLVNVLAEKILSTNTDGNNDHHIQEVLTVFPSLQYGMDVNPKFTRGPQGVEYTMQLNAFDLLRVELVHGWLLEPEADEYDLVANQSYNQLINIVIEGNDASDQLHNNNANHNADLAHKLSEKATKGTLVKHFLDRSSHQLTQYGLTTLHEFLKDGQIVVFFRNNHFNTLCKHDGLLYLLVTDLGYADVGSVVWEKLDVIDGDTEYVTGDFNRPPPIEHHQPSSSAAGELLVANNMQSQADYQLALQLSRENIPAPAATGTGQQQQPPPTGFLASAASAASSLLGTSTETPQQQQSPHHDPELEAAMQASLLHHNTSSISTTSQPVANTTGGGTVVALPPAPASAPPPSAPRPSAAASNQTMPVVVESAVLSPNSPPPRTPAAVVAPVSSGRPPNVAVGIPTQAPTQEELDLRMAMQIQRQEEQERAERLQQERHSSGLATALHKREQHVQQTRVSRPGPPPSAQPTAVVGAGGRGGRSGGRGSSSSKDSNCVIS